MRAPALARFLLVLQTVGLLVHPTLAQKHFQAWFPQYRDYFAGVVRDNCTAEVALYLHGHAPASCSGRPGCLVSNAVNCILANSRQSVIANTNSAAVLLGVLPATLGFIGSSSVETGLLWRRRPLLATLLAAGSPSVSPVRTIDYRGPHQILQHCVRGSHVVRPAAAVVAVAVVAGQYLLALAAVANIAHVSYQLCVRTVCSFNPETAFHPAVWASLSLPIHVFGTWAVWLRVRMRPHDDDDDDDDGGGGDKDGDNSNPIKGQHAPSLSPLRRLLPAEEFRLCTLQSAATLSARRDSLLLVLVSWATATGTVMHIIYGTLVFSSILFISAKDAIIVVLRYVASMIVCRAILMMEVSGLRDVLKIKNAQDGEKDGDGRANNSSILELAETPSRQQLHNSLLTRHTARHNATY